jgi:hypothetical protein
MSRGLLANATTAMFFPVLAGSPIAKTSVRASGENTGWLAFNEQSVAWIRPVPSRLTTRTAGKPVGLPRLR